MSDDTIFIDGLRLETFIGVYEWEQRVKQVVLLDLAFVPEVGGRGIHKAAVSDDISHSVDYGAVVGRIHAFVIAHRFQLLEALAERLAELLLSEFSIVQVTLRLRKLDALAQTQSVGVAIQRRKH